MEHRDITRRDLLKVLMGAGVALAVPTSAIAVTQEDVKATEGSLAAAQAQLDAVQAQLNTIAADYEKLTALLARKDEAEAELLELYEELE